jgi:adenosylhomocysteine nucleosidase
VSHVNTLVCFALKEEAGPFRKIAAGRPGVSIRLVGIGRRNAERSVREALAAEAAGVVFTCGFAGGLDPDLNVGDVVFAAGEGPAAIGARLAAAGAKPGRFLCADRVATTAAAKAALRRESGADAVEMESAAIQAVCGERGIACVTVRVISDPAGEDLPLDFNALAKPDLSLDLGKLAWAIAKSPGKIGALRVLQRNARLAAERLAAVLAPVIFP